MQDRNIIGLSDQDVQERKATGQCNGISQPTSKSIKQILKDNILTLFNLLNFLVFIALVMVHAWSNLVFMAIIIVNAGIGIFQEIKAKRLVDELSILTKPTVHVLRDEHIQEIDIQEIVKDDVLVLESGFQVCNDAEVIYGEIETNESLLTGESDPVYKKEGSLLLSGSSVVSGKCYARVTKVGEDNYATTLIRQAQQVKEQNSELLDSMNHVTKITTFLIIPLGILLFVEALIFRQDSLFYSVVSTSAGLLGMLPKGLLLLTSVSLANGVTRLARQNVLIQDLYSLETLSHVDVLCLDKTGTITDGHMKVEHVLTYGMHPQLSHTDIMGSYLRATDDNNVTFQAMSHYFQTNHILKDIKKVPFSSLRKWSAIEFENFGTIVVGAAEKIMLGNLPVEVEQYIDQGKRAIAVGYTSACVHAQSDLPKLQILMILILSDNIRENTRETLEYFHREGIDIKVISGDHVKTVCAIAKKAGVRYADQFIDMSTVKDHEIADIVRKYSVFGRVTPHQKKRIVEELKKAGHHVAMTGDGVNDLLALKEADCSIAIADGSDASKQVSQVVLLNSDFTCLPDVLLEGRKVVNNVTRVAGVFFIKTIYTILLSFLCIIANISFPFIPLQITIIDLFIEAMPSFLTMFESDTRKIEQPFLPHVFSKALPNGISIMLCFILILTFHSQFLFEYNQAVTIMYLVLGVISMIAVIRSCLPLTQLRLIVCVMMIIGFLSIVFLGTSYLHLEPITLRIVLYASIISCIGILLERIIYLCMKQFCITDKFFVSHLDS